MHPADGEQGDDLPQGGSGTVGGLTAAGVNYVGPSGSYSLNATPRTIATKLAAALNAYNSNSKSCANH